MANVNTIRCDYCGKLKGEVNHWWVIDANIKIKSMFIYPLEKIDDPRFESSFLEKNHIRIVSCGLECLSILESKIKEGVNPLK